MLKRVIGWMAICLLALLTGCASSSPRGVVLQCDCPTVPQHLTSELPAPERKLSNQRGLLLLLAEYEALRRRFNADRAVVVEIMMRGAGED